MWRYALTHSWLRLYNRLRNRPIHPWLNRAWHRAQWPRRQLCIDTPFLVVDLETSSLHVQDGEILSMGWVAIDQGKIQLNSAQHLYLKNTHSVGQSATIHQIRDCQLEDGLTIEQACYALLQAANGRVLAFHHSPMDLAFLNHYAKSFLGAKLHLPFVDTLQIEKRYLDRTDTPIQKGDLTLSKTRSRYHLPNYPAHNALSDALATAELLLAQISHKGVNARLQDILQ